MNKYYRVYAELSGGVTTIVGEVEINGKRYEGRFVSHCPRDREECNLCEVEEEALELFLKEFKEVL